MNKLKLEVGKTYVNGREDRIEVVSIGRFYPPKKDDLYVGSNGLLYYKNGNRHDGCWSADDLVEEWSGIPCTKQEWVEAAEDCFDCFADSLYELNEERIWKLLVLASQHLKEKE